MGDTDAGTISVKIAALTGDFAKSIEDARSPLKAICDQAEQAAVDFKAMGGGAEASAQGMRGFSGITSSLRGEVKESTSEMRVWNRSMMEFEHPVMSAKAAVADLGKAFEGIATGNYGEAIAGLGEGTMKVAMAAPQAGAALNMLPAIATALAPMAAIIGAIGIAVVGLGAIIYEGVQAWDAWKESIEGAKDSGERLKKALTEGLVQEIKDLNKETAATIDKTQDMIDGLSSTEAHVEKLNVRYFQLSNAIAGNNELYEQNIREMNEATDAATILAAAGRVDALAAKIDLEKKEIEAIKAAKEATLALDAAERQRAANQKAEEAARAAAAQRKEFSGGWGDSGLGGAQSVGGAMAGGDAGAAAWADAVKAGTEAALEKLNDSESIHFANTSRAIDAASQTAAADYANSLRNGAQNIGDKLFNATQGVFGPQIASNLGDFANKIHDALTKPLPAVAKSLAAGLAQVGGDFGHMATDVVKAAQSGSVFGVIAAVILSLLSKMKGFTEIIDMLSQSMQYMADIFNPFIEAIKPLIKLFIVFTELFTQLITNMSFAPLAISALSAVVKVFTDGIMLVLKEIAAAYNWIVDKIADFVGMFKSSWGDAVRKAKIDISKMGQSPDDPGATQQVAGQCTDLGGTVDNLNDSMTDLNKTTQQIGESLTNVPSWYKVNLARFNAASSVGGGGSSSVAGAAVGDQTHMEIGNVTVQANDPEQFARQMDDVRKRANVIRTGSARFAFATPYGTARVQGK